MCLTLRSPLFLAYYHYYVKSRANTLSTVSWAKLCPIFKHFYNPSRILIEISVHFVLYLFWSVAGRILYFQFSYDPLEKLFIPVDLLEAALGI